MANINNIMWNNQQPLTGDATRLAISALGNIANGWQALGANVNNGLDRLIQRYDSIDAKNKSANTQLLINQLHQADSLEDKQRLAAAGMNNLGSVRAMLGSNFDEKAYNDALAQWDAGIYNRFTADDALKISTPQAQKDYLLAQQAIGSNDSAALRDVIARGNLPLSTVNGLARAQQGIGINDQSRQDWLNENNLRMQMYGQSYQLAKQQADTAVNKSQQMAAATYENAWGAIAGNLNGIYSKYNLTPQRVNELFNSKNLNDKVMLENLKKEAAPYLASLGVTPDEWLKNPSLIAEMGNNGLFNKAMTNSIAARTALQGNSNVTNTSPNLAQQQAAEIQAVVSNPKLSQKDKEQQLIQLRNKHIRQNLSTNTSITSGSSDPLTNLIAEGDNVMANPTVDNDAMAAAIEIAKANGIEVDGLDPAYEVNKKSPAYIAVKQSYQNMTPIQKKQYLERTKQLGEYTKALNNELDSQININLGSGKPVPMQKILATPDPKYKDLVDNYNRLMQIGDVVGAETLVKNTLFANDSSGLDNYLPSKTGFAFKDQATKSLTEAMAANGGNPKTIEMYVNLIDNLRNGKQNVTNFGFDSDEATAILGAIPSLGKMNENTVRDYQERQNAINAIGRLNPSLAVRFINGNAGETWEEAIQKHGTKAQKEAVAYLKGKRVKISKQARETLKKVIEEDKPRKGFGSAGFGVYG